MKKQGTLNFLSSALAVVFGLLFGLIILLITDPSEGFRGLVTILIGGFSSGMSGVGTVLYQATPIIMTGLSVGFAFKTGLFNIGAPGQFTTGAFVAVYIGVKWTFLPAGIHWIVAILGAAIGGAIWGMVPGILKAYRNVNEVISSIMMNYIGMYMVNYLIRTLVYDSARNQTQPVADSANIPKAGLDKLFGTPNINIAIFIAIAFGILMYIIIQKTVFGFELKACGINMEASQYAGINAKRGIVQSMMIAGALAGIGGALLYLAGTGRFMQVVDVLSTEGFNGIPVALLGLSNPIGIIFAGLFISHITQGGTNLQLLGFTPQIIDIIISAIIYCGAFSLIFRRIVGKFIKTSGKESTE